MTLTIDPFEPSPEAYAGVSALWNALMPEWPRHPDVWQRLDQSAPGPIVRLVARRGGTIIGLADATASQLSGKPGEFSFSMVARPEVGGARALDRMYVALRETLASYAPRTLKVYVSDSRPWLMTYYLAQGFRDVQRTAFSQLDVAAFDVAPHTPAIARVLRNGFRLASLTDLAQEHDDWKRRYWTMYCQLIADVPMEGGFQPPPFEAFAEDMDDRDQFMPASTFIAHRDGIYVASSRLKVFPELRHIAFNDLTGTLDAHRRQGLATALKLAAIAYTREQGFRWITTLNDVDNPMLALNHALGFATRHIQHTLRLDVA